MQLTQNFKTWIIRNKKKVIIGGIVVVSIVGASVGYVLFKNKKISFSDWLKIASEEELEEVYEMLRMDFIKTGIKSYEMQEISSELGHRGALEWFEKHPPNTDPNYHWTDANRWDKD